MPTWVYAGGGLLLGCGLFIFFFWRLEEIFSFLSKIKQTAVKFLCRERKEKIDKWNFLFWREDDEWYSTEKLIAHAGGGHVGLGYTNSLDALEKSLSYKFKVIEIDVAISADGELICTHENKEIPTGQAFLNEKQDGRFKRMSLGDCLNALKEDSTLIIDVKDKKQLAKIAEILSEYVCEHTIKCEIVFQIFKEEDLGKVREFPVLYNLTYTEDYQRATGFCLLNGIHAVSIYKEKIYKNDAWKILVKHNVKVFAHTVNSLQEYLELQREGVSGVFTDFLAPKDLPN